MDKKILYNFFKGQATETEDEAIRKWLKESPDHLQSFIKERKAFDLFLLNAENTESEDISIPKNTFRSFYRKDIVRVAASIIITFLISGYFFIHIYENNDVAMQTIRVPAGQRLNMTLVDGTEVWLNAQTTLQYPAKFNKKHRTVILDGQAYFNIAKNEKAPFIVNTSFGNVEALGTEFDLFAYSDMSEYETVLINGKVNVSLKDDPTQTKTLSPSHKSYLENGELKTEFIDDFTELLWKEGLICFKDEPFEIIMKSFEKIYDIRIIIRNPLKRESLYTSKFRVSDGIEYAMRVLQKDAHFSYERDVDNNTITIN
ncbi:MAG: FecR family protein [Tannerella sp.]|jgi:ferric-dicitrate binding protein FerR (iron transport regulator)|nr:FecR family protein [Tannerella sp.]